MNKIQIENLVYEDVILDISDTDDGVKVCFKGTIDMEYPQAEIEPFLSQIHETVIEKKIKNVYCDYQELSYINSSGLRCLVKWIMQLSEIKDSENAYHLFFILNAEHKWQLSSLGFIVNMCPSHVHLQT